MFSYFSATNYAITVQFLVTYRTIYQLIYHNLPTLSFLTLIRLSLTYSYVRRTYPDVGVVAICSDDGFYLHSQPGCFPYREENTTTHILRHRSSYTNSDQVWYCEKQVGFR